MKRRHAGQTYDSCWHPRRPCPTDLQPPPARLILTHGPHRSAALRGMLGATNGSACGTPLGGASPGTRDVGFVTFPGCVIELAGRQGRGLRLAPGQTHRAGESPLRRGGSVPHRRGELGPDPASAPGGTSEVYGAELVYSALHGEAGCPGGGDHIPHSGDRVAKCVNAGHVP